MNFPIFFRVFSPKTRIICWLRRNWNTDTILGIIIASTTRPIEKYLVKLEFHHKLYELLNSLTFFLFYLLFSSLIENKINRVPLKIIKSSDSFNNSIYHLSTARIPAHFLLNAEGEEAFATIIIIIIIFCNKYSL